MPRKVIKVDMIKGVDLYVPVTSKTAERIAKASAASNSEDISPDKKVVLEGLDFEEEGGK